MKDGFFRIASATPEVKVADPAWNRQQIFTLIRRAAEAGCGAVCFPELCLTGSTCGDLFRDDLLLSAAESALAGLIADTAPLDILCAVGLPVAHKGSLYSCAAIFHGGRLLGLQPKKTIPGTSQGRWFSPGCTAPETFIPLDFAGEPVTMGDMLYQCDTVDGLLFGVELGEDLWGPEPPSAQQARLGATVLLNLSCANEIVGRAQHRRDLVKTWSGHTLSAYVMASAGPGESTTDLVFAGHDIIAENGSILAESELFAGPGLTVAEIDLQLLQHERRAMGAWPDSLREERVIWQCYSYRPETVEHFRPSRRFDPYPFLPGDPSALAERCQTILTMQSAALASRLSKIGCKTAVIGLSGGLDSTLALLVSVRAFDRLSLPRENIKALSMPCFGTTGRTKSNAQKIAEELGVSFREVSIEKAVRQHFADIGQDPEQLDVTFENAQARERTQVLMDAANQCGGLVVGTGDLSELALGWATYNGDHMSMYGVNGSVPKTLVRHLVRFEAKHSPEALRQALYDILDTPVSPELLPPKDGEIAQKTEELVGPYELHDFFLYYMLRCGFAPDKIYRMACRSFEGTHAPQTIKHWLTIFYRRFFAQQFKRSCLPDGPKVGSVSLSPRGDFCMPSDVSASLWLSQIDEL